MQKTSGVHCTVILLQWQGSGLFLKQLRIACAPPAAPRMARTPPLIEDTFFSPTSLGNLISFFHNLQPPSQKTPPAVNARKTHLWKGGKSVHYLHFLYNQAVTFLSGTYPKAFLLLVICSWEFNFFFLKDTEWRQHKDKLTRSEPRNCFQY